MSSVTRTTIPGPGLDALLAALRASGLHVGVTETLRLQEILARAPDLGAAELGMLVATVVAKSTEERALCDRIFRAWASQAETVLERWAPRPDGPAPIDRGPKIDGPAGGGGVRRDLPRDLRPSPFRWRFAALGAVAAVLLPVALIYVVPWLFAPSPRPGADAGPMVDGTGGAEAGVTSGTKADAGPTEAGVSGDAGAGAPQGTGDGGVALADDTPPDTRTYEDWVPRFEAAPRVDPLLGLSIVALAAAAAIGIALRNRRFVPPPIPPPSRAGPGEITLSFPPRKGFELLDARALEALVEGMHRTATDDESNLLDVERTVDATTRAGGFPHLRFQRQRRQRKVWLWVDTSAHDPAIPRLARELATALDRAGLDVERATFWAVPEKLKRADGTTFHPDDIDDAQGVVVAVLTDGRALAIRHGGADRRPRIARALRALARFPRLSFVDFTEGRHGLDAVVGPRNLLVVAPEDTAAFVAGAPPARSDARPAPTGDARAWTTLTGDARAWAAACALVPGPVDDDTAFAIRRVLALDVSPWLLRALRGEGEGIDWPFADRVALCTWIRRAERGERSLLARALAFWRDRHDAEEEARAARDAVEPWFGTPAERTLHMERALLDLWDRPDEAAHVLYQFRGTELDAILRRRLAVLAPLELEGTRDAVVLPWRLRDRPDEVRVMLGQLGLGSAAAPPPAEAFVARPGRFWLGVGMAAGLGLSALGIWRAQLQSTCMNDARETFFCTVAASQDGDLLVAGGNATVWATRRVHWNERVALLAARGSIPCEERPSPSFVVQRCGTASRSPVMPAPAFFPRRRIVILEGAPGDVTARDLATQLLDTRAADVVVRARAPSERDAATDLDAIDGALGRMSSFGADRIVIVHPPGVPSAAVRKAREADLERRFGGRWMEFDRTDATIVRNARTGACLVGVEWDQYPFETDREVAERRCWKDEDELLRDRVEGILTGPRPPTAAP